MCVLHSAAMLHRLGSFEAQGSSIPVAPGRGVPLVEHANWCGSASAGVAAMPLPAAHTIAWYMIVSVCAVAENEDKYKAAQHRLPHGLHGMLRHMYYLGFCDELQMSM